MNEAVLLAPNENKKLDSAVRLWLRAICVYTRIHHHFDAIQNKTRKNDDQGQRARSVQSPRWWTTGENFTEQDLGVEVRQKLCFRDSEPHDGSFVLTADARRPVAVCESGERVEVVDQASWKKSQRDGDGVEWLVSCGRILAITSPKED